MTLYKNTYRVESMRHRHWNYANDGVYFVTVNVCDGSPLFGVINDSCVILNGYGVIVRDEWLRTPAIRPHVVLDAFVIMPDHMHGIVCMCGGHNAGEVVRVFRSPSETLGAIVRGFKAAVTKQINVIRATPGARVWQSGYYDSIIRTERDWHDIHEYIRSNPEQWVQDGKS